jgi:hypothetical protein
MVWVAGVCTSTVYKGITLTNLKETSSRAFWSLLCRQATWSRPLIQILLVSNQISEFVETFMTLLWSDTATVSNRSLLTATSKINCEQRPNSWTKSRQKSLYFSALLFTVTSAALLWFLFLQTHATSSNFCKEERRKTRLKTIPPFPMV